MYELWEEFSWKLTMRYFRMPFIYSKYDSSKKKDLCWRDCKQVGNHLQEVILGRFLCSSTHGAMGKRKIYLLHVHSPSTLHQWQ